jgi:phenylpropionate dioxygenase-like ring-hydroxylating dioxygenase large terminal subunit
MRATHPALLEYWHPVAYAKDVPIDAPTSARMFGVELVLWRADRGIAAARNRCPHRGARLSKGWLTGRQLTCPYHAWQYGGDGRCTMIPQLDDDLPVPPKARLDVVSAREAYGLVWVCLGEPVADLPRFPEGEDPRYRVIPEFLEPWQASAPRIIDNSLDIAHTAVVHRNTIGDFSKPKVAPYQVSLRDDGLVAQVPVDAKGVEAQGAESNDEALRDVTVEIIAPYCFIGRIVYSTGVEHVLLTAATPLDDQSSLFVQLVARNDTEDQAPAAPIVELDRRVTLEDQWILENTDPDFPLTRTAEVHLRCDRVTVAYRDYLAGVIRRFEERADAG